MVVEGMKYYYYYYCWLIYETALFYLQLTHTTIFFWMTFTSSDPDYGQDSGVYLDFGFVI